MQVGEPGVEADRPPASAPTAGILLREPRNQVCPRARVMWLVSAVLQQLPVAAANVIWWLVDGEGPRTPHVAVGAALGALALGYVVVMPPWRFRVHRWESTPTAVYTQTGWLNQERRIAPVSRIQTVDMRRGPLSQVFRLASVRVTTASAAGPLEIHGLDRRVAERLVEELTVATSTETGDAT